MNILRHYKTRIHFYEIELSSKGVARLGIADEGAVMFFPESGGEYVIIVGDYGFYKFLRSDFLTEDFPHHFVEYFCEKMRYPKLDAIDIIDFLRKRYAWVAESLLKNGQAPKNFVKIRDLDGGTYEPLNDWDLDNLHDD